MTYYLARIGPAGRWLLAILVAIVVIALAAAATHSSAASSGVAGVIVGFLASASLRALAGRAPRCPHCRELVKHRDATVCSHCGRDLHTAPVPGIEQTAGNANRL